MIRPRQCDQSRLESFWFRAGPRLNLFHLSLVDVVIVNMAKLPSYPARLTLFDEITGWLTTPLPEGFAPS
jgi:hypothetical protein